MAAGNRGTVDIGHPGNSSSDLSRQILYGVNENDMSYHNYELVPPFTLNADTGLSSGIKDELDAIKGQMRAIPVFSSLTGGNGNNSYYTIECFMGVRILDVKLTGGNKYVIAQPCNFIDETVIRGTSTTIHQNETIFAPAVIIR